MENIESRAVIFANGGMDIGKATALLDAIGNIGTIAIDSHITNGRKEELPAYSIKHFPRILAAIIAIVILSPFLIVISLFIFASSIGSVLFNKERAIMVDKSFIKPGQLKTWHILPDGNELNFQTISLTRRN